MCIRDRWAAHIGATGRFIRDSGAETLKLSEAHAEIKLFISGQYQSSGENYRNSPKALNGALLEVIHSRAEGLIKEAIEVMRKRELVSLLGAEGEVAKVMAEIEKARK